jgi:hypothetical protein
MLYSIAGYADTDSSGQKHIVYVGTDHHLHALKAPLGSAGMGIWQYDLDITSAANATVGGVPDAIGHIGVIPPTTPGGPAQFIYWGADGQMHIIFPVPAGWNDIPLTSVNQLANGPPSSLYTNVQGLTTVVFFGGDLLIYGLQGSGIDWGVGNTFNISQLVDRI